MEITRGVHLIPGIRISRVYLIEDNTLTLVDTGFPWNVRRVLKYVESIGRRPEELTHILMTHNHPDHTSGAPGITKATGAEIVAHSHDTKAHSDDRRSLGYMKVFGSLDVRLPFFQHSPVAHLVNDDDTPSSLNGIRVIHTPGHTPGSVCYLLGGMAKNVFKRVVEYGDAWMPNRVTPEDIKKGRATLDELAEAAGRDPSSIDIYVFGQPADRDLIGQFEDAGAIRVAVRLETAAEEDALANLEKIAEAVL